MPRSTARRTARVGVVVALIAPLVLAGPGAQAQTRTMRDKVGDARKHIDIRGVTVSHRKKKVVATIRGRRGQAGFSKRAVDYAYLRVRSAGGSYFASASPGRRPAVTLIDSDGAETVSCPKLRVRFDFRHSRIRIRVPRSCVGFPAKLRGDVQVQSGNTGRLHDEVAWSRPIRRGWSEATATGRRGLR